MKVSSSCINFPFNSFVHPICAQVSQAAAAAASSAVGGDVRHHLGQHNGGSTSGMPGHHTNQQMSQQDTLSPDLGKCENHFLTHVPNHGILIE